MRARFAVVESLVEIKTYAAVEAAFDHVKDLLRLCRSDNMGVRSVLPALALRLGRDQECYDFCKWYATTGEESDYAWGDMSLPFLNVKNADVFEPVLESWTKSWADLGHTIAITLLKFRLLTDLRTVQNTSLIEHKLPREMLDSACSQLLSGSVIAKNREVISTVDQAGRIGELEKQIRLLYRAVKKENKHLWPALLNPGAHLTARPGSYSHGSREQMQIVLRSSYDAWVETPGSLDRIQTVPSPNLSRYPSTEKNTFKAQHRVQIRS
ncbi:MAG: hypothetical protein Q9222_005170 [Ikaeria aurantiellina]